MFSKLQNTLVRLAYWLGVLNQVTAYSGLQLGIQPFRQFQFGAQCFMGILGDTELALHPFNRSLVGVGPLCRFRRFHGCVLFFQHQDLASQ